MSQMLYFTFVAHLLGAFESEHLLEEQHHHLSAGLLHAAVPVLAQCPLSSPVKMQTLWISSNIEVFNYRGEAGYHKNGENCPIFVLDV